MKSEGLCRLDKKKGEIKADYKQEKETVRRQMLKIYNNIIIYYHGEQKEIISSRK